MDFKKEEEGKKAVSKKSLQSKLQELGKNRKFVFLYILACVVIVILLISFAVGFYKTDQLNDLLEEKAYECKVDGFGVVKIEEADEGWDLECICPDKGMETDWGCINSLNKDGMYLEIHKLNLTYTPKAVI